MSADDVFSSRATSEAINSASQTSVSPTKASPRIFQTFPLRNGKVWKMRGEAFVGETLVCEAEFMASLVARDENTSSADKNLIHCRAKLKIRDFFSTLMYLLHVQ